MQGKQLVQKCLRAFANTAMVLMAVAAILLSACSAEKKPEAPVSQGVEKHYERGPLSLDLSLDRLSISTAETIRLELKATLPEGQEAEFQDPGKKLGEFSVKDSRDSQPKLSEAGKVAFVHTLVLEPFLAGEYKIPPLKMTFWKTGEQEKHTVETEEIPVTVTSVLPKEEAKPELKEILPPVGLPRSFRWLAYAVPVLLALVALVGVVWLLKRRQRNTALPLERQIPPHTRALDALEALLTEGLVERGDHKEFYFRLSAILRHYIEERFGLNAPERTTEEFLVELGVSDVLVQDHKILLRNFLRHCDLVKFALHDPGYAEIQEATESCRRFILDTIPQPVERDV